MLPSRIDRRSQHQHNGLPCQLQADEPMSLNLDAGASVALAEASMVGDPARGFVIISVAAEIDKVKRRGVGT